MILEVEVSHIIIKRVNKIKLTNENDTYFNIYLKE